MQFHNVVGLVGVVIIILAYFLLQTGRLSREILAFSLMNALGSSLILYSLYFEFNLPSAVIELVWLLISIYGVIRCVREGAKRQTGRH
jgi:predicted membrane-bound mannosyltransferase